VAGTSGGLIGKPTKLKLRASNERGAPQTSALSPGFQRVTFHEFTLEKNKSNPGDDNGCVPKFTASAENL
jgi:hypothetical protein